MAAVASETTNDDLNRVFKGLFFVSKWLGMFPFTIKNGEFHKSPLLYAISIAITAIWSTVAIQVTDIDELVGEDHLLKRLSKILPMFTLFTVLPCNILWLSFHAKKLEYVMAILKKLDMRVIQTASPLHFWKKIFVAILLSELVFEIYLAFAVDSDRSISYIFIFMLLSAFLIADQFATVLYVLRRYYSHICDGLDLSTAVEYTNAHDLLGKCSREVNDCYSPQLLLIIVSVFVYIVSGLYTIIMKYINFKTADPIDSYYILMFVAVIFHFLTACRLTTLQSKKFDTLLYRLIINDKTKSLMRNNRILLHFKAMKDLEFSAMEFFNFDYSLICSVVSTATTYIVILVQFS